MTAAPAAKPSTPKPAPPKPKRPKTKLHLMREPKSAPDGYGLYPLRLTLFSEHNEELARVTVCSGAPWTQEFRTGEASQAGSREPLPQGIYRVDPKPYWAGTPGDYYTKWSAALGPVVIDLFPEFKTSRSELRIHIDGNRQQAPGTAGCIGTLNLADLKEVIGWFGDRGEGSKFGAAPEVLVVNYGLPGATPLKDVPA